jgi:hypothetical protein
MNRYFVTIHARSADDLRRVQKHGFDVFAQTAKRAAVAATTSAATEAAAPAAPEFGFTVEALLSTAEIETLVKEGLRVLVEDTAEARSHPTGQTLEFAEWLEQMKPALAGDRAARR